MISRRLFASLLVATPGIAAYEDSPEKTSGLRNGRSWTAYTTEEKLGYILGHWDTLTFTLGHIGTEIHPDVDLSRWIEQFSTQLTVGEWIAAIDTMYAEPLNLFLPITAIMSVVAAKAHGESAGQVEHRLSVFRSAWSK